MLKPFWRYYGGKWRAAPRYPVPRYDAIVEPFAGAAGYSMRYPDRRVILIEKYAVIAEIWRYLIAVKPEEILAIPEVEHVDDLPAWVPQGARWLVGFSMNDAAASPRKSLAIGRKRCRDRGSSCQGWCPALKQRIASQVERIRHWKVIEGDFTTAPDIEGTWYIDPPYQGQGKYYIHSELDYSALGKWCLDRRGQVLVCENEGAMWLPFKPFAAFKPGINSRGRKSQEVLWDSDNA